MLNEKQVTEEVERSLIRSAIYSLPRRWKFAALLVIVVGTFAYHRLH